MERISFGPATSSWAFSSPALLPYFSRLSLSVMLSHEPGVLSAVLGHISEQGASVLTITQSLPIHGRASVTLSLDVSSMGIRLPELLEKLEKTPGVEKPKLLAVE